MCPIRWMLYEVATSTGPPPVFKAFLLDSAVDDRLPGLPPVDGTSRPDPCSHHQQSGFNPPIWEFKVPLQSKLSPSSSMNVHFSQHCENLPVNLFVHQNLLQRLSIHHETQDVQFTWIIIHELLDVTRRGRFVFLIGSKVRDASSLDWTFQTRRTDDDDDDTQRSPSNSR